MKKEKRWGILTIYALFPGYKTKKEAEIDLEKKREDLKDSNPQVVELRGKEE